MDTTEPSSYFIHQPRISVSDSIYQRFHRLFQSHQDFCKYVDTCVDNLCKGRKPRSIILIGDSSNTLNATRYAHFMLSDPEDIEIFSAENLSKKGTECLAELFISERFFLVVASNVGEVKRLPKAFFDECVVFDMDSGKQIDTNTIHQLYTASQDSTEVRESNVFRWRGGTWEIVYDGKVIRPPDSKGLRYIHHLISNKNESIFSLDLMNTINDIQPEENRRVLLKRSTQVDDGELTERLKDGIPPKQLKEALYVLNQKLESAETLDERESIQKQIDQITDRLESITGENSADKARVAVSNAINRALERIKEEHLLLYEHFSLSIKTGGSFKYETAEDIQWTLE